MWARGAVYSGPKVVSTLCQAFNSQSYSVFRNSNFLHSLVFPWILKPELEKRMQLCGNLSCNQCCRNCLLRHNLLYLFFLRCEICCATCVASANELFIWVWCHVIIEKARQVAKNVASCNTRYATTCLAMSDSNYNLRGNFCLVCF